MKKKLKILLVSVFAAMSLMTSCSNMDDIKITSFEIVSVTPRGVNGLDALVKIGINNPSFAFEVTDLIGTLRLEGVPCLSISTDQLIVAGKTAKTYNVPLQGQMADGFNPFQLLRIINGYSLDFDKLTLDVHGRAALRGGIGKKLEFNDIKIGEYLVKNKEKNE